MNYIKKTKAEFRNPSESESLVVNTAVFLICIIAIFSIGYLMGSLSKPIVTETANTTYFVDSTTTTTTTTVTTTAPSTAAPETQAPATDTTAPTAADTAVESTASNGTPSSVAEILALYNESANKVKTNASKVTRNFEDREVLNLVVPSAVQSLADKIIAEALGDDTEPVDYTTAEDIKANFIVPGQDYVSKLTEADLAYATCNDNGTEYEIEIAAKGQANPTAGTGVGAGFDVIETAEIKSSSYASLLESIDVTYSDCIVKCKIDKATGNMIWASYYTPVEVHVIVSMFGSHEANVGISFLKDYTITY